MPKNRRLKSFTLKGYGPSKQPRHFQSNKEELIRPNPPYIILPYQYTTRSITTLPITLQYRYIGVFNDHDDSLPFLILIYLGDNPWLTQQLPWQPWAPWPPPYKLSTSGTYYHLITNPALLQISENYYPIRSHRPYTYTCSPHTTCNRRPLPLPQPHGGCWV